MFVTRGNLLFSKVFVCFGFSEITKNYLVFTTIFYL